MQKGIYKNKKTEEKTMKTRVLSLVIAAIMLLSVFTLASCGNKGFDYAKKDLSGYITLTEADYMNIPVEIATGITAGDVYYTITEKLAEMDDEKIASIAKSDKVIAENDIAHIYYRGVVADANGKETGFEGGTNFGEEEATWLYIGSDMFIEGFEDALIGKNSADTSVTFVKEGTVAETDFIVLEIAGMYGDAKTYLSYENLAVKLDETDILPFSIIEKIVGKTVGEEISFELSIDADGDKTEETVKFEAKVLSKIDCTPEKITVTFPSDYSDSTLAGKEAFFYVVILDVITPDAATAEAFGYEAGEDAAASIKAGVEADLVKEYIDGLMGKEGEEGYGENYAATIKNAIWAEISGGEYDVVYPEGTIESYIKTEKNNLEYEYNMSEDKDSIQATYKTLEDYAAYIYGTEDWEATLLSDAKDFVKRKLVFYTVAKALDVNSATSQEKKEVKEELLSAYIDYYAQLYTAYNSILGWGYTTEQVAALAANNAQAVVANMTDTFLYETVVKEKMVDKIYENYDAETLVKWTTSVNEVEADAE